MQYMLMFYETPDDFTQRESTPDFDMKTGSAPPFPSSFPMASSPPAETTVTLVEFGETEVMDAFQGDMTLDLSVVRDVPAESRTTEV